MKSILVYTQFSENCYHALKYAINLAQDLKQGVVIATPVNASQSTGMLMSINMRLVEEAHRDFEIVKERLVKDGLEGVNNLSLITVKNNSQDNILKLLKKKGAEFMIMANKADHEDDNIFIGTEPGSFIRRTDVPVLLIPKECQYRSIDTVLFALKRPEITHQSMLKPIKVFTKYLGAKISFLVVNNIQSKIKLGTHLSGLNFEMVNFIKQKGIHQHTSDYLRKNKFDLLCVIRRKKGFFSKFLINTTMLREQFDTDIPMLVLHGEKKKLT